MIAGAGAVGGGVIALVHGLGIWSARAAYYD